MEIANFLGEARQRWRRFWFQAGDPTTMSFLRVIVGCLCLYIYSVYTLDLYSFFGPDAWYDLKTANRIRWEEPTRFPIIGWEHQDLYDSPVLPEGPLARQAVMAWIRGLPTKTDELKKKVRLFDTERVLNADAPNYPLTGYPFGMAWFGVEHALILSPDPTVRKATLEAIVDKSKRDKREAVPEVFDIKDLDRKRFAEDLDEFYTSLPAGGDRAADRRAIVSYLQNIPQLAKNRLLEFLGQLCEERCTPGDRALRLDYFERWGGDRNRVLENGRIGHPTFSFWYHITDPVEMAIAHAVVLLIMLCFALGLFTRVTSVLTWLASVSYIHRNPQVLFGQDTMLNILLIYFMIAKSGATFSLDRVIERYRLVRASLKRTGGIDAATALALAVPPPSVASHFAQRLLQVHFCFIYMASGLSKLKGGLWWSGDAMWYTLVNPEFTMIHFEWYRELLRGMFSWRPFYAFVAATGVGFTIFTEISLPYLAWTRMRPWIVLCGFALHFGIGVFMGLLVFSLLMMTMLASFLPGWAIREFVYGDAPAAPNPRKVDASNGTDAHEAALAVAWDRTGSIEVSKKA